MTDSIMILMDSSGNHTGAPCSHQTSYLLTRHYAQVTFIDMTSHYALVCLH